MKIAVLTLPLINNYGGILQAYATMRMLEELGHSPVLVNLKRKRGGKFFIKFFIKKYCLFFMNGYKNATIKYQATTAKAFIDNYIKPKTAEIYSNKQLSDFFDNNKFDACIVGSDQVFRTMGDVSFPNIYSLGFVDDNVIKIAYAASFGGEYKGDLSKVDLHSKNLKKFKTVLVRESSAVKICKDLFDVDATHILDPTMMIDKSYYINLFKDIKYSKTENKIFAYVLDKNTKKDDIINRFAKSKNIDTYQLNDGNGTTNVVSIEQWLKNIYDAEYVITDSFHGCVFSMIFNKPFYCFVNKRRGADRFYSLLNTFNLTDRIIKTDLVKQNINWNAVEEIKQQKVKLSKLSSLCVESNTNSICSNNMLI